MTGKPRLLDLFCGEGLAAAGFVAAGFEVHGVDSNPKLRKRYLASGATSFTVADATSYPLGGFLARHASPPCEDLSPTMGFGLADRGTGWMLPHMIERFKTELGDSPWTVENVEGPVNRRLMPGAVMLCGSSFGLGAHDSRGQYRVLRRHRLFVSSLDVTAPACECRGKLIGGVFGHGEQGVNGGRGYGFAADAARAAMQAPWASRNGCSDGIPPAYGKFWGDAMMASLMTGVPRAGR